MTPSHRVFVYGTLMRGEFHHDLMADAAFECEARTHPCYRMVWMEYYPALLAGGDQSVHGEVFRISNTGLAQLDLLEEHPEVYIRETDTLQDGSKAFLYVLRPSHLMDAQPVPSGNFRDVPEAKRRP